MFDDFTPDEMQTGCDFVKNRSCRLCLLFSFNNKAQLVRWTEDKLTLYISLASDFDSVM